MTAQAGDTTSSLARQKAALRKALRACRRELPRAARRQASQRAAQHLALLCRQLSARFVAVYLGVPEEMDTAPAIARLRRQGCALYVPKVGADGRMQFVQLRARAALRPNRYGIAEPAGGTRPPRLDVIVLPLVGFDDAGRRLGMGGGYYDRVLAGLPRRRPLRVGLAYAAQETARVPTEAHDARLHAVVTEHAIRRFP